MSVTAQPVSEFRTHPSDDECAPLPREGFVSLSALKGLAWTFGAADQDRRATPYVLK